MDFHKLHSFASAGAVAACEEGGEEVKDAALGGRCMLAPCPQHLPAASWQGTPLVLAPTKTPPGGCLLGVSPLKATF